MYQTQMMNQVLDYQKVLFDSSFSVLAAVQDQTGEAVEMMCDKHAILPESTKKACTHWMTFFQQNRSSFKGYVDDSFDRIKEFFEDPKKPARAQGAKK